MEVIDILGRKYSSEILAAADEPIAASELSNELSIPIATCYRRLKELTAAGLLTQHHDKQVDGRSVTRFQRTTDAIDIRFGETVSLYTWPRETEPVTLGRLVSNPFIQFGVTERLPWLGRTISSERSRTEPTAPQQPLRQDSNPNSSSDY